MNPEHLALEDRLRLLTTKQPGNKVPRLLQPQELGDMLETDWVTGGVPLAVWRIEDIAVESVTARWLAWYYGLTKLGPDDELPEISKLQFKRLCAKIHPDKVSKHCLPCIDNALPETC